MFAATIHYGGYVGKFLHLELIDIAVHFVGAHHRLEYRFAMVIFVNCEDELTFQSFVHGRCRTENRQLPTTKPTEKSSHSEMLFSRSKLGED